MLDLDEITVQKLQEAYRQGIKCEFVVASYIQRIEQLDQHGPKLNSVTAVSSAALEDARALDLHFEQTHGELVGPLHGVPVLIKDLIETKHLATSFGNECFSNYMPREDATVVARLKKAGAIILGKTTLPDFAMSYFSHSSVSTWTKNPYCLDRDAGGSSSGCAAATAANFCVFSIGTDTGGSIRLPSSFCNLVGLRPTPGLVSRAGIMPLVSYQDTPGPMTRTVMDAAISLDIIAGFDPRDPFTFASSIGRPTEGYAAALKSSVLPLDSIRLGVLTEGLGTDRDSQPVNEVIQKYLRQLESSGVTLVPISIPDIHKFRFSMPVFAAESRRAIDGFLRERPEAPMPSLDAVVSSKRYFASLEHLNAIANGLVEGAEPFDGKLAECEQFARSLGSVICEHDISALVFPDVQWIAPSQQQVFAEDANGLSYPTNTLISAQCRFPALSIPAGFTSDTGMPVGLELLGLPHSEAHLLEVGLRLEQALPQRQAPRFS